MMSILIEQLINITDAIFLGRVGEVELGASAIAGVYYLAIFMIGFGFTVGSQILIARRNGEGNYRTIGNIFYQGIYFLMLVSAVIFTLSQLFSEQILGSLIASPHIIDAATDYIQWRVYGFFFSFTGAMFRAFSRSALAIPFRLYSGATARQQIILCFFESSRTPTTVSAFFTHNARFSPIKRRTVLR